MFNDTESPLVFTARMISEIKEDAERKFAVNYYMTDRTIMVIEGKDPRRGIQGGRFLSRMKAINPRTGEPFNDADFGLGEILTISGRDFELIDAPEYTLCQMEAHSNRFPKADLQNAMESVAAAGDLTADFEALDPRKSGKIAVADVASVFAKYSTISKQAAVTVTRRFTDGTFFNYKEMLQFISMI